MRAPLLLLIGLFLCAAGAFAQPDLSSFNRERDHINRRGFLVLGSWSAASIIAGVAGQSSAGGQGKYFHRMNIIWGSVNLLIALPGYIGARRSNESLSLEESVKGQAAIEKIFIFNAGLDLAYLAGGAWFLEKANTSSNPDKYRGFGKSILMQGAALLLFDVVMFSSHNRHGRKIFRVLNGLQLAPNSLGFSARF